MPRIEIVDPVAAGDRVVDEWGNSVHLMSQNWLHGVIDGTIKVGIGPQEWGNKQAPTPDGKEYIFTLDFQLPGTKIIEKIQWRADIKFPDVSPTAPANPRNLDLWGQVIA